LEKAVYIVIGCDTDPDRDYFVSDIPTGSLSWRGMLEGIPRAKEQLHGLTDSDGKPPAFTWLIRADHQIRQIHGAYDYILQNHTDFLLELEKSGDELGWHPHFWRCMKDGKTWYQEHKDHQWQVEMLREAHAAYQATLPGRPRTVRMGWAYHNNRTLATLDELGIEVEISALPGLKIRPGKGSASMSNYYDWSITPSRPYYPSRADYRREPKDSEGSYALLEAPNTVAGSFVWGLVSGVALARKMKDIRQLGYALSKPAFISTITSKPVLFKPMLRQVKKDLARRDSVFYVTPLHPDELIDNMHPVYSLEHMKANLGAILELAEHVGAKTRYITGSEIKDHFRA